MFISYVVDVDGTVRKKEGEIDSVGHLKTTSIDPPYGQPRSYPRLVATLELECDDTAQALAIAQSIVTAMQRELASRPK